VQTPSLSSKGRIPGGLSYRENRAHPRKEEEHLHRGKREGVLQEKKREYQEKLLARIEDVFSLAEWGILLPDQGKEKKAQ